MKNLFLVFFLFITSTLKASTTDSITKNSGFSVSIVPAQVLILDEYVAKWLKKKGTLSVDFNYLYTAIPNNSDAFARDFNYPSLGVGLRYTHSNTTMKREKDTDWGLLEPVNYTSKLGDLLSLYGSFNRSVYRSKHWEMGYSFNAGVALATNKYNNQTNIDNEFLGSTMLIYFGAGAFTTYYPCSQWGIKLGIDFFHHSNGALYRPNKGANYLGPNIGLVYFPARKDILTASKTQSQNTFTKRLYTTFTLGVGVKTLNEEWQRTQFNTPPTSDEYRTESFKMYMAYSFNANMMLRYARRWASGIGLDLFYGSYSKRVAELDATQHLQLKHSPWSFGVSAKHQVYYHNISLAVSLGAYLYRNMGNNANIIERPYYETVGLHYSFPHMKGLTIGAEVKAHATKADLTQVILQVPISIKSYK